MKGSTLLVGVIALGVGIAFSAPLIQRLPAPVGNWLARAGGSGDVVATLVTSVHKINDLSVFGAQLYSIARTQHEGLIEALDTTTYVIVRGSVRYVVNLSAPTRENFNWDAKTRALVVVVPDPSPTDVNVDGAHAYRLLDGVDLSSSKEGARILQASLVTARDDMAVKARDRELMRLAKEAGRVALQGNFAAPLIAAGLQPTVTVRFRSEALLKG